jgi:hypothetical protein
MRKIIILFLLLGVSEVSFARLKMKHVIGEWSYIATIENNKMEGVFKFTEKDGKLSGEYIPSVNLANSLTKIEIHNKNILRFELQRENDDPIKFILTVYKNKFTGEGWISNAKFEIIGEKQNHLN